VALNLTRAPGIVLPHVDVIHVVFSIGLVSRPDYGRDMSLPLSRATLTLVSGANSNCRRTQSERPTKFPLRGSHAGFGPCVPSTLLIEGPFENVSVRSNHVDVTMTGASKRPCDGRTRS